MNNDKKMPQGDQNQKPGGKPDMDQKKPQSNQGIGQEHNKDKDRQQQGSVKPDVGNDSFNKPQSSKNLGNKDLDQGNEVDDDDDRITQRAPSRGNEPQRK